MGAKSPTKLKLRRATFKCNICGRKLLSAQALKTHQFSVHKVEGTRVPSKTATKIVTKPKLVTKKVPATVSKVTKPVNKPKSSALVIEHSDDDTDIIAPEKVTDLRKIQFECPKCNVLFPAYYPAYKHIQKSHCVNSKGQKVDPASSELIKPMRVETCVKCNKRVRANEMHSCCDTTLPDDNLLSYLCMGCKQKFATMQLFDLHVSGLHSDSVESLFFPNMNEFLSWKTYMQNKTNTNYLILGKCNSKQTYRCTYLPPSETTIHTSTSQICPSTIIIQEFTKGIQVHFYKNHYGHTCPQYKCNDTFKKYLITSLMQEKNGEPYDVAYDEKDLYCQFKVLLESIIIEAAKVKVDDLKLMLEKALEMTSILNNYDEDDDSYTYSFKRTLGDEQISKALENLKSFSKKRKRNDNDGDSVDQKKKREAIPKIVNESLAKNENNEIRNDEKKDEEMIPKIVNAFSIADKKAKKVDAKTPDVKKYELAKNENVASPRILRNSQIQPSFNDSYKDFVDKNFLGKPAENASSPKPSRTAKNKTVKESQLTTPAEKGLRVRPLSKLVETKDILEELTKDFSDVPASKSVSNYKTKEVTIQKQFSPDLTIKLVPLVPANENKGPNIGPERPIEVATPKTDVKDTKGPVVHKQFTPKIKPKKQVMKTKIGQFKPSLSPKSPPPKKPDLNRSIGKVKPDIEYEVKEQENDCNILILKI